MDKEIEALRRGFRGHVKAYRDWFVFFALLPHFTWDHQPSAR